MGRVTLATEEALIQFARSLRLEGRRILALTGPLGAGKTTFVKGLVPPASERDVQSPTFTLLNPYPTLFHFDLYRLKSTADFLALGFDEYFEQGFCVIEWPERIASLLPPDTLHIDIAPHPDGSRTLSLNWDPVLN